MTAVRQGRAVRVTATDVAAADFAGRITAVDSVVDPATRNVQAQATVANPGGKLRPGMFVQAEVTLGAPSRVISLPASAISHAAFGDSVFVVAELKDPQRPGLSRRAAAVRQGRTRPRRSDFGAVRAESAARKS